MDVFCHALWAVMTMWIRLIDGVAHTYGAEYVVAVLDRHWRSQNVLQVASAKERVSTPLSYHILPLFTTTHT